MTEEKFKRLIKIVFAVLAVVFVIGAAVIIVSGLHEEREESAAVESIEQEMGNGSFFGSDDHGAPGAPGLAVEDPYSETGEPGDDGEKEDPRKYVFTPVVPATRKGSRSIRAVLTTEVLRRNSRPGWTHMATSTGFTKMSLVHWEKSGSTYPRFMRLL